jgi:hypothetical protein
MIRTGDIIKHERSLDVAYNVINNDIKRAGQSTIFIGAIILNQGFVTTYGIGKYVEFEIKQEDLKKWLKCIDPEKVCIRYSRWETLSD